METILDMLQVKTWRDLPLVMIDAMIVYYILYRIILIIRGTRAAQMLLGLFLVIIAFFLSGERYLDLRVTRWMLDKFIANFILITVVIFQEDIRRALARAGRASWFATSTAIQETYVLEEVIKASVQLSKHGLGALIVIEREADLDHYTAEGVQLDAAVSKDLLFSLFLPEHQNALHDGAVVIQKGRITSAGVALPMTQDTRRDMSLGMRHRAGIGLSEENDAAIVIVSEETSIISLAHRGELIRDLDGNRLRELLQAIFRAQADTSKRSTFREVLERWRPERRTLDDRDDDGDAGARGEATEQRDEAKAESEENEPVHV